MGLFDYTRTNLVKNPSFEEPLEGTWKTNYPDIARRDTWGPYSGKYYVYLSYGPGQEPGILYQDGFACSEYMLLYLAAAIQGTGPPNYMKLRFSFFTIDGKWIFSRDKPFVAGEGEWKIASFTYVTPPKAATYRIELYVDHLCNAKFDDVFHPPPIPLQVESHNVLLVTRAQ